nr:uncharacterized protein LOC123765416 [Procambarus clarkii]
MNLGHPCSHCREGRVRPFQFSLDQAILRCDNTECDSLLVSPPWESIINRNIRQQIPRRSADFGHHRFWGGSSSSSGVQSDIRSPLMSPAQSLGSVTDKEVELLLRKSYAPPKFTKNKKSYSKRCPTSLNCNDLPASFQPPILKDNSKCESFFELLGSLDLDSTPHANPLANDSPPVASYNNSGLDIVTAELESWMKGFESPTFNNVTSESVEVNPSTAGSNLYNHFRKNISKSRISEKQQLIIPSQGSAFSQISTLKEKNGLNSNTCQEFAIDFSTSPSLMLQENTNIKTLAHNDLENDTNPTSLICLKNDPVKYDLSALCDSQFLSPATSAVSDDSGYNEEDASKVPVVALPQLHEESSDVSSCSRIHMESMEAVDTNEISKCKFMTASSHANLKSLISMDLKISTPHDPPHFNIHPAIVTIEKCCNLNKQTDVESELLESHEDAGLSPANHSINFGEVPLGGEDDDIQADNGSDLDIFFENTPNFSRSFNIEQESNNIDLVSRDDSTSNTEISGGLTTEPSQAAVTQEHCDTSSQFGSTLLSDGAEDIESKVSHSDHSSDLLSLCSVVNTNQYNESSRGKRHGRGRRRKRGKSQQVSDTYQSGGANVCSSNSNLEVSNDAVTKLKGKKGRGCGRGSNRGRGRKNVNNIPGLSELQPNKRPRVPPEMLPRQTRQRTGYIEVQATTPRERFCNEFTSEDNCDGNMRRGLSTLLQGPSWQVPERRNNDHSRNLTNLSFRSLLNGSLVKDPWSVMELYLEELDIEVVVQGVRSASIRNEETSTPEFSGIADGGRIDTSGCVHSVELKETDGMAKGEETNGMAKGEETENSHNVQISEMLNKSLFQVCCNDGCGVLPEKETNVTRNCDEMSSSEICKENKSVTLNVCVTNTSTPDTGIVDISKKSDHTVNNNKDEVQPGKVLIGKQSCITSHIPLNYRDSDVNCLKEIDQQSFGCIKHFHKESLAKINLDWKQLRKDPQNNKIIQCHQECQFEDLKNNKDSSNIQILFKSQKEQNSNVPEKDAHFSEEITAPNASFKEEININIKSKIENNQDVLKGENLPVQVEYEQVFAQAQELSGDEQVIEKNKQPLHNNEQDINKIKQPLHNAVENSCSLGVSDNILGENKEQYLFSEQFKHNTQEEMLQPAVAVIKEQKTIHNKSGFVNFGYLQNEIRINKQPSQNKNVLNLCESSLDVNKYENVKISQTPDSLQHLFSKNNDKCSKSKDIDTSLKKYSVVKNSVQKFTESVEKEENCELQCTKESTEEMGFSNQNFILDALPQKSNNFFNKSLSTSGSSLNCLLLSPDFENVRSWMGYQESSSPKEQAEITSSIKYEKEKLIESSKEQICTEATISNSSSKYFGSLLQDVDFDDKFFQCPVQEHPSQTFDEHTNSTLFFGETANSSPPQANNMESIKYSNVNLNQDLNAKCMYYLQQREKGQENINSLKLTTKESVLTTPSQICAIPISTNIETAFQPMKVPVLPSIVDMRKHVVDPKSPTIVNNETTVLPSSLTFALSTISSTPFTTAPVSLCNCMYTNSVLPMIMSTTVPSHAVNSSPVCSGASLSEVSALSRKSQRNERYSSLNREFHEDSVGKEPLLSTIHTCTVKDVSNKFSTTNITKDVTETSFLPNMTSLKSNIINSYEKGCSFDDGKLNTNFIATTVNLHDVKCEGNIGNISENIEPIFEVSSTSQVTKNAEKGLQPSKILACSSAIEKLDPKLACDEDNDGFPIISIDSEDEIQIIIPEKKCKFKKTVENNFFHSGSCKCEVGSKCVCYFTRQKQGEKSKSYVIKSCPKFKCKGEMEACTIEKERTQDDNLKDFTGIKKFAFGLDHGGIKRMIEKSEDSRPTKKNKSVSSILHEKDKINKFNEKDSNSSEVTNAEQMVLMCGILDNSIVHDKECYSPRVKEFVDFDESARKSSSLGNFRFYFASKKSKNEQCQERSVVVKQFESVMRNNEEDSHTLKEDSKAQKEKNQISQKGKNFERKFGCAKSSPQHDTSSASKWDECDPGLLELDCGYSDFLSPVIPSSGSYMSSLESSQHNRRLGNGQSCHNIKPFEDIGSGEKVCDMQSMLTDTTHYDLLGSRCEEKLQTMSETNVHDGLQEESVCEESKKLSNVQNPRFLSNMMVQINNSEGQLLKCVPVTNSTCMMNKNHLDGTDTNPPLKVKHSKDCFKPEMAARTMILSSKCIPSQTHTVPALPLRSNLTCNSTEPINANSALSSAMSHFSQSKKRNYNLTNKSVLNMYNTTAYQKNGESNSSVVELLEPGDAYLSKKLSPPMKTCTNNLNSCKHCCNHFSQLQSQESVIDYQAPISAKNLTVVPPALVTSYGNNIPSGRVFMQTNSTCNLRENVKSTSTDNLERIVAVTSQTIHGPVTQVLRVAAPAKQSQYKIDNCQINCTSKRENNHIDSLDKESKKTCIENTMLKKVKMGSKGGFYFRPTSTLMNAIIQMRKKKELEAQNKGKNLKNSMYVELPDGEPISHPIFIPKKICQPEIVKSKKRKFKKERKTNNFVRQKVLEIVEQRENKDVPEMVVVCVGGKLYIYQRDAA